MIWSVVGCAALLVTGYAISGCAQGSGGTSSTGMAKLTTAITDPAECSMAVGGTYQAVYVTITDVQANTSSSAGANGSGWVDLTPKMQPTQVNLLGGPNSPAGNGCFLATLGDNLEVQAGNYQQIRLILGSNSSTMLPAGTNSCSGVSAVNCVEDSNGNWHALKTPSAQQTGIKIPAAQIAGGSLDVAAGKAEDLVINFKTCQSILKAGNSGQWILKPVLNAGEVKTASTSINGTVVDATTMKPLPSGYNVLVSLEEVDGNGVDRIVESTPAASNGTFVFCPVMPPDSPATSYDVVVNAYDPTTGAAYNVAVETGVQPGDTTGDIPLTSAGNGAVTLNGVVTTTTAATSGTPISEMVNVTPLEPNPVANASTKYITIPLLQDPPTMDTASLGTLTTGTMYQDLTNPTTTANCSAISASVDCASYFMTVPQSGISVYNYSTSGPTPATSTYSTTDASYLVDGIVVSSSGATTGPGTCTPSEEPSDLSSVTPTKITAAAATTPLPTVTVNPVTGPLVFTGCQ